jgi:peptide-methionine (R)-S-oxide reductase
MLQAVGIAVAGALGWRAKAWGEGTGSAAAPAGETKKDGAKDGPASESGKAKLVLSEEQWRAVLAPPAFAVLRKEATERPGSSALNAEKRTGTFVCAGCFQPLFKSEHKYESGTGWPSFFDVIPDAIGTRRDFTLLVPRTEYHCSRCEGHQGHVFEDGPKPTGLRYCNNGVALQFVPSGEAMPALRESA